MKSRSRRTAHSARFTARLAGLAVLALVGSGCSGAEPGVVAYVADTKITQDELNEAFAGVTATLPDQQIELIPLIQRGGAHTSGTGDLRGHLAPFGDSH